MSDVQDLPGSQTDIESGLASNPATPAMEEPTAASGTSEAESAETRKRRRFRPDEIAIANKFIALAEPGTPIEFNTLETELKRAVLPNRQTRLVDRGLLEVDYDEDTGFLKTVCVMPDMLKEYEWDLKPPVVSPFVTKSGQPRQRRPRNILADAKYKIMMLSDDNPKRKGSHAFYNWEHCYHNGQSIPDYLSQMNYPRSIVTNKGTYFNGPSTLYLEQDLKNGSIGIYDLTLPFKLEDGSKNEAIWLKPEDLNRLMDDAPEEPEEPEEEEASAEMAE